MSEERVMGTTTVPAWFLVEHLEKGFPWCDACRQPAVYSEFRGLVHVTPEYPGGVPERLDDSGHRVTTREWWHPGRVRAETLRVQGTVADFYAVEAGRLGGGLGDRLRRVAANLREGDR